MSVVRWILIGVGSLLGVGALAGLGGLFALSRNQPDTQSLDLGVREGRLAPCPDSPNCVSSFADDDLHSIDPIAYAGSRESVRSTAMGWIEAQSRASVVTVREDYIHAVFRSPSFGFMDDLELFFPEESSLIQVRSAARVGYGDMGVNRTRVETLRSRLQED